MNKLFLKIKPYLIHYGIFAVVLIAAIFIYRHYYYRTKTVIKPIYKTLTKVLPVTETKIQYKPYAVNHIEYIPEKEYLTITKTKTVPEILKNKKVLAVGNVPAYGGQTQVVCALDKNEKASLLFKQLPYVKSPKKFFSLRQSPYIQGGYGFLTDKNGTVQSGIISVGDKFLRTGNLTFKVKDSIFLNSRNTVNFIGVTAQYNF